MTTKTATKPTETPADNTPTAGAPATIMVAGKVREVPVITGIRSDISIPVAISNRGAKSLYNFDTLEIGQSIGVKNKTAKQLASVVSNFNRSAGNREVIKNPDGSTVFKMQDLTDANGVVTKVPTTEPETRAIKEIAVFNVDPAKDPDGATARVFRIK